VKTLGGAWGYAGGVTISLGFFLLWPGWCGGSRVLLPKRAWVVGLVGGALRGVGAVGGALLWGGRFGSASMLRLLCAAGCGFDT